MTDKGDSNDGNNSVPDIECLLKTLKCRLTRRQRELIFGEKHRPRRNKCKENCEEKNN